jgi:transcriptional regulator with GAF, ATPase, and Fis domain
MSEVFEKVRAVAPTESTVLITGETGTGKGVIAKLIHEHSRRADKQFISVHCGAIPDTLLESELFGHEKGAFTGAIRRKLGKFEIAQGGTIFLDEIGTISSSMQIKLLQVLQERTFQRVGGELSISADVRIIIATNADLQKMCQEGSFRRDLFYRLNVFPIEIPPLRERLADIPLLLDTFLKKLNRFSLKNIRDFAPGFLTVMQSYDWPGNIRELENLVERAFIIEETPILTIESLPKDLVSDETFKSPIANLTQSLKTVRLRAVETAEQRYLVELLKEHNGKINDTAAAAGIGVRQLHKLMIKYKLKKEDFRNRSQLEK